MPKFQCHCGFVLDLIECPSEFEYSLIPEKSIEEAGDYVEGESTSRDGLFDILDKVSKVVYKCSKCQRLYIEKEKGLNDFFQYVLVS